MFAGAHDPVFGLQALGPTGVRHPVFWWDRRAEAWIDFPAAERQPPPVPSPGFVPGGVRTSTVVAETWKAPDGSDVLLRLSVHCPSCGYPIQLQAVEGLFDATAITINAELRCPGHWRTRDERGRFVTDERGRVQRTSCRWRGVVHDGIAHTTDCGLSKGCDCVRMKEP